MTIVYESITSETDLELLLANLLQDGLSLVPGSVTYQGADNQGSIFTNGGTIIGIESGILFTSGDGSPSGINTSPGSSVSTGSGSNALLSAAGGLPTNDANVINFSLNVVDPTIVSATFSFVFGSEEYPEYVNSFPDIGAIVVNGINYAKFSNGQPLTVTSANLSVGSFQNNTSGSIALEYDGISNKLTITVPLNWGVNTISMGAADLNDSALDSGLFVGKIIGKTDNVGGGVINVAPILTDPPAQLPDGAPNAPYIVTQSQLLTGYFDTEGKQLKVGNVEVNKGEVKENSEGDFVVTPPANFVGPITLTYDVEDGDGGEVEGSLSFEIDGPIAPPSAPNGDSIDAYGKVIDNNGDGKTSGTNGRDQIVASNAQDVGYMYGRSGNDSFHFIADKTSTKVEATIDYVIYDFHGAGGNAGAEQDFLHFTGYGAESTIEIATDLGSNGIGQNFGTVGTYYFYRITDSSTGDEFVMKLKSMNGQQLSSSDYGFYSPAF